MRGIPCAVCTNKPESLARRLLAAVQLGPSLIPVVLGGDTTPEAKPSPVPLLEALARLQTSPQRALLVGDSEVDVACGRAAGVPVVLMAHGYASDRTLYVRHEAVASDFPGLSDWLVKRLDANQSDYVQDPAKETLQ
jgi:phosphoglycolate phosphatase